MDEKLTEDAKYMILSVYKLYLERIRDGLLKRTAVEFVDPLYLQSELFPTWPMPDITKTVAELGQNGLVKNYRGGGFILLDSGITFCENHFGNSISKLADAILKIKSLSSS